MNSRKICISVCAETADEMIARIRCAEPLADVVEVRFDCLQPTQLDVLLAQIQSFEFRKPLLATYRSHEQGGKRPLSTDERSTFWRKTIAKFWAADVEEDMFEEAADWPIRILSFHSLGKTSVNHASAYDRLLSFNADVIKIASPAADITDSIPIWRLIKRAASANRAIIPISTGEAGKWTRILGLAHGACMTYASLDEGEETAAGQVAAKDLIEVYRVKELDENTHVYGIIGDPVSGSMSPIMQNAAFKHRRMNAVFVPLLVKDLDKFIRRMVAPSTREVELNFAGFCVTMPHKQTIIRHLDELDAVAAKIGAVNTIKLEGDKLIGYNTDAHGFIAPLKAHFGDVRGARAAVLGAGGAARACVYALMKEGADVTVFARNLQTAAAFKEEFGANIEQLPLRNGHLPTKTEILVNATPVGMKDKFENETLLNAESLSGVKFVYDLVARPVTTALISEAKKAGIPAIGGVEMFIAQGVRQFEIWTGRDAPTDVMRQSVTNFLAKTL